MTSLMIVCFVLVLRMKLYSNDEKLKKAYF